MSQYFLVMVLDWCSISFCFFIWFFSISFHNGLSYHLPCREGDRLQSIVLPGNLYTSRTLGRAGKIEANPSYAHKLFESLPCCGQDQSLSTQKNGFFPSAAGLINEALDPLSGTDPPARLSECVFHLTWTLFLFCSSFNTKQTFHHKMNITL